MPCRGLRAGVDLVVVPAEGGEAVEAMRTVNPAGAAEPGQDVHAPSPREISRLSRNDELDEEQLIFFDKLAT
jgi:hypothetical protein